MLALGPVPAAGQDPAVRAGPVPTSGPGRVEILIVEPGGDPATWGYEPAEVTVEAGTTVAWRNTGTVAHTVTAEDGSFSSPNLKPGSTWEWTFAAPADAPYHCSPHPWMRAVVHVVG
jgi:plastocyanin